MSDVDFRTKYEWWRAQPSPRAVESPDEIERLYAEAHPKRVTADEVRLGFVRAADGTGVTPFGLACDEVRDLRNAERDESWIEDVPQALIVALSAVDDSGVGFSSYEWSQSELTAISKCIRTAYRKSRGGEA